LGLIERREAVEVGSHVRMLRAERLLSDGKNALVQLLGLCGLFLVVIECGQGTDAPCDLRMVEAKRFFPDCYGLLNERLRLMIFALANVQFS
tara:strand:- start:290 stop:565 length:276 start_codon:yes stop_codon:yes gene_type:complete